MDELYFESGYLVSNYFVYTANASSLLGSYIDGGYLVVDYFPETGIQSSLTCIGEIVIGFTVEAYGTWSSSYSVTAVAVKSVSVGSTLSVTFTQSVNGQRGRDIDLFAFTNAALAAAVSRIRDNNVTVTSVFSIATDGRVFRDVGSAESSEFTISVINQRSRATSLEMQTAFSFSITDTVFNNAAADITATATLSADVYRVKQVSAAVTSAGTVSADAIRIKQFDIAVNGQFTLSADGINFEGATLTAFNTATLSAIITKTASFALNKANLESNSYLYAITAKNRRNRPINIDAGSSSFDWWSSTPSAKYGSHHIRLSSFQSDKIVSDQNDEVLIKAGEDFIVELWVRGTGQATSSQDPAIIGVGAFATTDMRFPSVIQDSWMLGLVGNSNTPQFRWNNNGTFNTITLPVGLATSQESTWNLIKVRRESGVLSLGLNGVDLYPGFTSSYNNTAAANVAFRIPNTANNRRLKVLQGYGVGLLYVDDIHFKRGSATSSYNTGVAAVNDPNNTVLLWHLDNSNLDDTSVVQQAGAALPAVSTVSAAFKGTYLFAAALSSTATVTAVIGTLEQISLEAFPNAALSATVIRIQGTNATLNSQASISAVVNAVKNGVSAISAQSTQATQGARIRFGDSAQSSSFSTNQTVVKTASAIATLSAVTTVTAVIGKLEEINLVAFANAAVATQAVKTVSASSTQLVVSAVSSQPVKTVTANGTLLSEVSVSVSADKIRNGASTVSSSCALTAVVNKFSGVSAGLSLVARTTQLYYDADYIENGYYQQTDILINKIASGQVSMSVAASLTASIRTDVFIAMSTSSSASVSATVVKTANVIAAESSASSLNVIAVKTARITSSATSQFSLVCNAITSGEINLVAFSNAALSATVFANKPLAATALSAVVTVFANTQDSLNSVGSANISSEFALSTQPIKTVNAVIITTAIATELVATAVTRLADVACSSQFTTSITINKITGYASAMSSQSSMVITAVKTVSVTKTLATVASLSADAYRVKQFTIATEAVATELAAVVKIGAFFINANIVSTVAVTANKIVRAGSAITSTATLTVTISKIVRAVVVNTSIATVVAIPGKRIDIVANLTSAMTFVVAIRDLRLDEVVYKIPGEGRSYKITSETRLFDISSETRKYTISEETSLRTIESETRIHTVT